MSFIQENIINININLKKEYTLIHFSDVHVININKKDSKDEYEKALNQEKAWYRVRKDFANHFNEICAEEHLIPSCECLDNLLNYTYKNNPDAFIMSGDIIDYYSESNVNYLKEKLKNISIPYLLCIGNHEIKEGIYDELTNNHSDYNVLEFEEFKIVSLDNSRKKFNKRQLEKLTNETKDKKPIFLCMHIPIKTSTNEKDMAIYNSYFIIDENNCDDESKRFIEYISNNNLIKGIFCGHTHGKGISYFAKDKFQHCASSGLIGYVNKIIVK